MSKLFCILLYLCVLQQQSSGQRQSPTDEISTILTKLEENYDKRIRPNYSGKAVEVGLTIYVLSLDSSAFDKDPSALTLTMYFRQSWNDPRLSFKPVRQINAITLDGQHATPFWSPDTFFPNEISRKESHSFFRVSDNGDILLSKKMDVTFSCPMDFAHYPMDQQRCDLEIESFGHTMMDIKYVWGKGESSLGVAPNTFSPSFSLRHFSPSTRHITLSSGNYSRLDVEFLLRRSLGYHLLSHYFPSGILVLISFTSFWMWSDTRRGGSFRIILGLITTITLLLFAACVNSALPKISYIKAIDVWLWGCFLFSFLTFLDSHTISYLFYRNNVKRDGFGCPQICDSIASVLFPLGFVIFNVWYWRTYLSREEMQGL